MPDRPPKREPSHLPTKTCAACGREITWRKAWERHWDDIRFCSDRCRSHRPTPTDQQLEKTILDLLAQRGAGKTICPSEAARAVAGDERAAWEPLMEPAREAARRLVAQQRLVITQHGHPVDPSRAKGRIRLRLP